MILETNLQTKHSGLMDFSFLSPYLPVILIDLLAYITDSAHKLKRIHAIRASKFRNKTISYRQQGWRQKNNN